MIIEIKVPSPGESITQVLLAAWLADDGAYVEKDAEIAEIESDKATLVVYAAESGILRHVIKAGETVDVDALIATVDPSGQPSEAVPGKEKTTGRKETPVAKTEDLPKNVHLTPLAKSIIEKKGIPAEKLETIHKSRITSKDLSQLTAAGKPKSSGDLRPVKRIKISPLRHKLAERLVSVKNETAMLTTFNEVNMSAIMEIRKNYGETFKQKYGSGPGFNTFFMKAAAIALGEFSLVNSSIDGDEIVQPEYADICVAVSTPKGLLAPAIRDVQKLSIPDIEQKIRDFATRAQQNKITLDELSGGTFTISNGGVFGSLLSTPIINPPQSAILGLHKVEDRPVALEGKVVIQPMMYIALSYDHRLIDGKESVSFVVKIKQLIEKPELMLGEKGGKIEDLLGI